jgi:hypothetical protein
MSSLEKRLFKIQEEILESGSDNELYSYVLEMNEMAKKLFFSGIQEKNPRHI